MRDTSVVQDILFKCSTLQAKIGVQGSGKTMKIPAKKVVKFSAGKAFKEALNLKKGKKKQP